MTNIAITQNKDQDFFLFGISVETYDLLPKLYDFGIGKWVIN